MLAQRNASLAASDDDDNLLDRHARPPLDTADISRVRKRDSHPARSSLPASNRCFRRSSPSASIQARVRQYARNFRLEAEHLGSTPTRNTPSSHEPLWGG